MTGTNVARFTHKSVPVIFEPPCTISSVRVTSAFHTQSIYGFRVILRKDKHCFLKYHRRKHSVIETKRLFSESTEILHAFNTLYSSVFRRSVKDDFVVNMVNRNYWSQTHRKASTITSVEGHTDNAVIHMMSHVKAPPPRAVREGSNSSRLMKVTSSLYYHVTQW